MITSLRLLVGRLWILSLKRFISGWYDNFRECSCCVTERNTDQGTECNCGNFICSSEACLGTSIILSLSDIQAQQGNKLCPMCQDKMSLQNTAALLSVLPPGNSYISPSLWTAKWKVSTTSYSRYLTVDLTRTFLGYSQVMTMTKPSWQRKPNQTQQKQEIKHWTLSALIVTPST